MVAAMTTIGLYFAALAVPDKIPGYAPLVLFYVALVFTFLFILSGVIYMCFFAKLHLNPICFLDNVRCIYWTAEKQIEVGWSFCDFSKSTVFVFSCVVCFGEQRVNIDGRRSLNTVSDPNAKCINGSRIVVEQSKYDVEIYSPEKCEINIKVKPHGFGWATKRKTIEVVTQIVSH